MKEVLVFSGGAYPFITAGDKEFERSCRLEFYIASGPGGQKRNRTYSAVRATHKKTNISAIAEESRSQADNKEKSMNYPAAELRGIHTMRNLQIVSVVHGISVYKFFLDL